MTAQPMPTNFTTLDLFAWHEEGTLELSPKFQRRGVWKPAAKGFFIDTLLRGFPVPPLHIRMSATRAGTLRREVIDGQQRLRTVFDFFSGKLRLSRTLHSPWAGMTVDEISEEDRLRLRLSPFHVYQYSEIDDATVLEIFARLNTYSIALNSQELRNGRYFGEFKSVVYDLAWRYLEAWRVQRIFTESAIARMAEAELVSELLVLQMDWIQDKKKSLNAFYSALDSEWPESITPIPSGRNTEAFPARWLTKAQSIEQFDNTMATVSDIAGDLLPVSPFRRVPLFYTLYSVVLAELYGVPGVDNLKKRPRALSSARMASIRSGVEEFTDALDVDPEDDAVPRWKRDLVVASSRQTDNLIPRTIRFDALSALSGL